MSEVQTIPLTCRQCSHRVLVPREWWEPAEAVEVRGLCPKCATGTEKDESWDYYDADGNELMDEVDEVLGIKAAGLDANAERFA